MQKCRWFRKVERKTTALSGTPRSRGNPNKHAAQAPNITLPWTAGPHCWGRATHRMAVQAEHTLDYQSLIWPSSTSSLSLCVASDALPPLHFLLYSTALPRKEQPFLQTLAPIPSGRLLFEASFL